MKGILLKRNNSWFIEYTSINGAPNLIEIHPEYEKCYFLDEDADGGEVEFEIVNKLWGVNDAIISYAKLVINSYLLFFKYSLQILWHIFLLLSLVIYLNFH